ncbi:MAG: hypothetical protein HY958_06450 [Bacteroidia bacterium]|nr:hypothetical protein [Bacteroidia bacterium]
MKKFLPHIILLCLLSSLVFLFSCKKRTQQKLIGTWEMVSYNANPSVFTYSFKDGDQLIREYKGHDGTSQTDTAYYYIEVKNFKKIIKITEMKGIFGYPTPDGKWWVDKLNNRILTMTRVEMPDLSGGPYLRYEFIKK